YTNFLWVLMIAGGMRLGADPVGLSQALGLACFVGSLVAVYRIGMTVLPTFRWALVSTLLVGTHYSVLCFAACGLETSLQTLLLLCGCWTLVSAHRRETWRRRDAILLALLIAAGMFTRMDFALFGVVLFGGALASILRTGHPPAEETQRYVVDRVGYLLVPVVAILGGWCVWKIAYYDSILPNTFYAKRPSTGMMSPGLAYLGAFCTSYRYPLPLLVFLLGVVELARKRNILLTLALIVVVWCGYMVCIGGDFIEFRFLVPVVPLFILVLIWTATHFSWSRRFYLPVLLTVLTGYGSLHHANAFGWSQDRAEPVAQLRLQTTEALWGEAGDALREWFGEEGVVIATTAAGILPYRARLTTVDMHGLNDALIARQAPVVSNRPGHFRLARVSDLRERNVHLVIGHPKIELESVLAGWPPPRWASCVQAADRFEDDAIILGIPMETGHVLLAWYLTPHAAIDDAVATRGWPTAVVSPDGEVWRHGQ
ncbi:MAG: hypothetical protein GY842_10945, partial [bacterium]|nr:hypothetical protein [bacterium]